MELFFRRPRIYAGDLKLLGRPPPAQQQFEELEIEGDEATRAYYQLAVQEQALGFRLAQHDRERQNALQMVNEAKIEEKGEIETELYRVQAAIALMAAREGKAVRGADPYIQRHRELISAAHGAEVVNFDAEVSGCCMGAPIPSYRADSMRQDMLVNRASPTDALRSLAPLLEEASPGDDEQFWEKADLRGGVSQNTLAAHPSGSLVSAPSSAAASLAAPTSKAMPPRKASAGPVMTEAALPKPAPLAPPTSASSVRPSPIRPPPSSNRPSPSPAMPSHPRPTASPAAAAASRQSPLSR